MLFLFLSVTTILIHSGNQEGRKRTALKLLAEKGVEEGTSLIKIGEEKEKLGIKEIKTLLPHLHVKLTSKRRGLAIFEAQQLTIAAQNSLLKTLEEPPAHLIIVLTAPHPRLLLPTVVSRCVTTEAQRETEARKKETESELVGEILIAQGGQRLALFEEKIGYRQEDVLLFLDEAEAYLKERLNSRNAQSLTKLWQAKKLLRNESANIKLVIDEFLFSW